MYKTFFSFSKENILSSIALCRSTFKKDLHIFTKKCTNSPHILCHRNVVVCGEMEFSFLMPLSFSFIHIFAQCTKKSVLKNLLLQRLEKEYFYWCLCA